MSKFIMLFLLFHAWIPAWAQIEENNLPPVLEMFEAPALELGVSKDVTMAIADVESGLSPWVLTIEGQSFQFDSKENALKASWLHLQHFYELLWRLYFSLSPDSPRRIVESIYNGDDKV